MANAASIQVIIDEHYKRCVMALQTIAQLADTGSRAHKERFQPNGEGDGIANGWRVAEAMREVANDVIGNDPICDSCGGEGQVQLTDEGGNRMWWACPACRPLEQIRTMECELRELPERVEGTEPECPWCHTTQEMPGWVEKYHTFDCECGGRFQSEKETVLVSRPMEFRK